MDGRRSWVKPGRHFFKLFFMRKRVAPKIDRVGKRYGKLLVLSKSKTVGNSLFWVCRCDCGNITEVSSGNLGTSTNSCGCKNNITHTTHGMSKTRRYRIWQTMIMRCTNPAATSYESYGGKGVMVCSRWLESFKSFYEDTKEGYADNLSLDRYPNRNGNYEPGNVRWATPEQQNNNKDRNVFLEYKGVTMSVTQWSRLIGISRNSLDRALVRHGGVENTLGLYEKKYNFGDKLGKCLNPYP